MKQDLMRGNRGPWGAVVRGWLASGWLASGLLALVSAPAWAASALPVPWEDFPLPPGLTATQLTCFGSSRFVYAPAMGNTPRDVTVTLSSLYSGCLALSGQGVSSVSVQAATTTFSGVTCSEVLSTSPELITLVWNNGTTSVVQLAPAEVNAEETTTTVTFTGKVVEGTFKGLSVARSSTYVNTDLGSRCLSSAGLTDASVFSLLVLTQPR